MESFLKDINEIEDLSKTGREFPYRKLVMKVLKGSAVLRKKQMFLSGPRVYAV